MSEAGFPQLIGMHGQQEDRTNLSEDVRGAFEHAQLGTFDIDFYDIRTEAQFFRGRIEGNGRDEQARGL